MADKARKRADEGFTLTGSVVEPLVSFYADASKFISECESPNQQFVDVARATLMGFLVMGFTGYLVKLVHIPINQILVGA